MLEISAEIARKMSKDNLDSESKNQREDVFNLIEKEIDKGSFSCYYYEDLKDVTIKYLEQKGYTIENQTNQKDGSQYCISW